MMTYAQWRRAMFWGRIAHAVLIRSPQWFLYSRLGMWLLPYAGFYAYSPDDGYEGYAARCTALNQRDTFENLH